MSIIPGYRPAGSSLSRTDEWSAHSVPFGYFPSTMRLSPEGRALLQAVEGLKLKPYNDQTSSEIAEWVTGATIGYGHLILEGEWARWKDGITEAQALTLFKEDLWPTVQTVRKAITVALQLHEFDALVIFVYNIGGHKFTKSTVLQIINSGPRTESDTHELELSWKSWNISQKQVNPGLINRRKCEWKIFSQTVYERWNR